MRFITIATLFSFLAAALPAAAPADQATSVAVRGDNSELSVAARDDLSRRQGMNPIDQTVSWPETTYTGGGLSAQYEAKNLNNGNYQFTLSTSGPANGGNLRFRISYGGVTLAEKVLPPAGGKDTVVVKKTGDNFNMWIDLA
ncbi:hypothetical protein KVR01_008118 [Diaporthe batatas]|uniref:uncharacterized protein n=1 Tax=Diaporthe batatas TaxID=748121 RepID=UPI001D0551EF|nr:uncharacterized protein KVR01_008118 [Diaporthe batatas]KAG8162353.1 hypothetical protein KVR01_008118 [Diaporthe batatas]